MINLSPLQPALARGDLILTPNNRLKQKILQTAANAQSAPVCRQANVMSLDEWLDLQAERLFFQQPDHPLAAATIASAPVRRRLWADILAQSEASFSLIHPRKTAEQLDQAYSYLALWRLDSAAFAALGFEAEWGRLQAWITPFHQRLQALGLCTREQCLQALLSAQPAQVPAVLVNTENLPPLYAQLLDRLSGHWQALQTNQAVAVDLARVACPDAASEAASAARWAHDTLRANPGQRIAIIDPNLGNRRSLLERALNREFEPGLMLPGTDRYTPPYNFSAGTPLASLPAIHAALLTLGWQADKSPDQAALWLVSPFVGWAGDEPLRHWLLSQLRQQSPERIGKAHLLNALDVAAGQDALQTWTHHIALWRQWANTPTGVATSGANWGARFLQQLEAVNWPGPRVLDSEEHQQVSQFYGLLEQLRDADLLGQPLSHGDALAWLSELASRQPFQPQTPESPLQVLGVLESAGLAFDQIWVMGMEDSQWPPAPAPNPLLPALLQREYQMPHASAERELAFCEAITRDYRAAAHRVLFSYPERDGDRELSPSPLIADLPPLAPAAPTMPTLNSTPLAWLSTLSAPPVSPAELADLRGGAALLQKQARCPLAAFFEIRLGAGRPDPFVPGLSALDRGNLLHQALFYFYTVQSEPTALDDQALAAAADAAIDRAIAELPGPGKPRLLALERQRLQRLLLSWLALERDRPVFRVQALEQAADFKLGELPLSLRIDRIDAVDGHWLLIDYKSGRTNTRHWLEPLEEPQLPLYAVALADRGEPVAAIAFAELRQKNQSLDGLGAHALAPGIQPIDDKSGHPDWPALVNHWREALLTLADDLLQGRTAHRYSSRQSQDYLAHLTPLLRTAEQRQLHEDNL